MANPNDIRVLFEQALRKHQAGHFGGAEKLYRRILGLQPNHRDSLHLLGAIRLESKHYIEAIKLIEKALGLGQDVAAICFNLARAYEDSGQLDAALAMYKRAQAQNPRDVDTVIAIGCVLAAQKHYAEALHTFNHALEIAPQHTSAMNNKGLALKNLGQSDEALKCFLSLLEVDPQHRETMLNLAVLLDSLNRIDEAYNVYSQFLNIEPNHVGALLYCGKYSSVIEHSEEAISYFNRVLAVDPGNVEVLPHLLFERCKVADWRDLDVNIARVQRALSKSVTSFQPYYLARLIDSPELMLQASQWMASSRIADERRQMVAKPLANRRLRVGYVSSDLHAKHPVFQTIEGVLALHDRAHFEIHHFRLPHSATGTTPDVPPSLAGTVHELKGLTDLEKLDIMRKAELDIAVDLNGFTKDHGYPLFSQGIAPVQVNYLGFPGTMGSTSHDYVIGDRTVLPPESFAHYSEQVVWLPGSFFPMNTQRPVTSPTPTRIAAGLPETGFVFGCFSTVDRILPAVFESWVRILTAVQNSVLWLKTDDEQTRNNIQSVAKTLGLSADRIVFARRTESNSDHLARLKLMDLCLDTLPFNAHSTALDCLYVGVPVLTLAGKIFAARVAASLLQACGLSELICTDRESYEDYAIKLAMMPELLQAVKMRLQLARRDAPFFNTETYTRSLEKAYTMMIERNAQGLPPQHFSVT
jgi:protein O-GlcNAc transferase